MFVRRELIRWTVLLCAGLFSTMLVLGQDRGQTRLGLKDNRTVLATRSVPVAPQPDIAPIRTNVSLPFAPPEPLIDIAPGETLNQPAVATSASNGDDAQLVMYVQSARANLRAGPGKSHAVIAKLTIGQTVELASPALSGAEWLLVRAGDDRAEGYIAASLLTKSAP